MRLNYIDCCDNVQGLQRLPDNCIDLTVTSPPYDNLRAYNDFSWDFEGLAAEIYRVTKPGGVVVWIVNDATVKGSETGTSFKQALHFKEIGFNLHDTMIWRKVSPFQHKNRYIPSFEYMFVFSKGTPRTANLIKDRKNKYAGNKSHGTERTREGHTRPRSEKQKQNVVKDFGARFNIWDIPGQRGANAHPAVFPEQLATDHVLSWSNPGDVVLDPFMGSGTTAVACLRTGRNYIGFELSREYCDIAEQRIAAEMCQQEEEWMT